MPWYVIPQGPFDWETRGWATGLLSGATQLAPLRWSRGEIPEAAIGLWIPSSAPLTDIMKALPPEGAPYVATKVNWGQAGVVPLMPTDAASLVQGMLYRCRDDRDWTMDWVSPGALELTGYSAEQMVGENSISYSGLIHPADRQSVQDGVHRALAEKQSFVLRYRIRQRSGNTIWVVEKGKAVYSDEGRVAGLVGHIAADGAAGGHAVNEQPTEPNTFACSVVVVDDEASIVNLLARLLERSNYRVIRATNMEEALHQVIAYEGTVDVLLTDVVLERGSGCDLAEKLRWRLPHLRVIYMSGYAADGRVLEEVNQGRAAFLSKPFLPSVAVEKIREVMRDK